MQERLQKIISAAGVASRRAAEQLITEGRVRVNGTVVTELGTKADPSKDHIKVDGKLINPKQPLIYIMLNKPAGYVTTMSDPEGRPTVQDLLKGVKARVYPVGRLDYNTEGLLLLTNDGEFAHLITHPRHEFPKTYLAKVKGVLEDRQINELEKGIYLDDGRTAPAKLKKKSKEEANSWVEITIHEGRKRQVRRMFDRVGHSVIKLKRIKTGNLLLGDLHEGAFRYLTPSEVKALTELAVKDNKTERERPNPDDSRAVRAGQGTWYEGRRRSPSTKAHGMESDEGPRRLMMKGRRGQSLDSRGKGFRGDNRAGFAARRPTEGGSRTPSGKKQRPLTGHKAGMPNDRSGRRSRRSSR